jgi:predicted transcriptional regulator
MKYSRFKISKGHRPKWEIYDEMLETLTSTSKTTAIMRNAKVSFKQKEKYVNEMGKLDFIRINYEYGNKKYEVTDKGKEFQKQLKGLLSLLR